MKDLLLLKLKKFLEERKLNHAPVLLGYSGGPDSKALLHLLSEARRFFSFELHLAHVDHGWREESAEQAMQLKRSTGLPFHLLQLKREDFSQGNWEEQGRIQRLHFFSEIYQAIGAQALMLGHQADDQAEVVLKRVLEGAALSSLSGISSDSQLFGMRVLRPLLGVSKKELLAYLTERQIDYIEDPTNQDPRFLRAKMRQQMFPALEQSFGKEIAGNLCRLGEESEQIKTYFSQLNAPLLSTRRVLGGEEELDLNPFLPLSLVQVKYLLREWLCQDRALFSREILDKAAAACLIRGEEKRFSTQRGTIRIERGVVSLLKG